MSRWAQNYQRENRRVLPVRAETLQAYMERADFLRPKAAAKS
jgi:hypothetical protein